MPDKPAGNTGLLNLISRLGRGSERKKITLNKRALIFFFFLVLSILFWFLTAMNKEYTTAIAYPVRYIRFPDEKVLVNEIPDRLELTVNASGYTLLRYQWRSRIAPIVFDVNSFSLNTLYNDPSRVYILTTFARERIANQLSSDIQILGISPDSLVFQFADRIKKSVPVVPELDLGFEKQFMQTGPFVVEPDSILLSGPEVMLDTILAVKTESLSIPGLNSSFERELPVKRMPKIDMDPAEVWVKVHVEKSTEATLRLPIEVLNLPDSLILRTFPSHISINFQVGLSAYEAMNVHLFRAVVNYAEAGSMLGNKLQVKIDRMPDYIESLNYSPKAVEYILEK